MTVGQVSNLSVSINQFNRDPQEIAESLEVPDRAAAKSISYVPSSLPGGISAIFAGELVSVP